MNKNLLEALRLVLDCKTISQEVKQEVVRAIMLPTINNTITVGSKGVKI